MSALLTRGKRRRFIKAGRTPLNNTLPALTLLIFCHPSYADDVDIEHILIEGSQHTSTFSNSSLLTRHLDGDWLAQQPDANLQSLSDYFPSLNLSANSTASKVYFRGVGSQGNAGLDQTLAIYIDQSYQGRSRSINTALIDVDEVALYRGAQFTLQGINSTAGALSISTHTAVLDETSGSATLQTGQYGQLGGTAIWNQAIGDTLAIRAVLHRSDNNGYWTMIDQSGDAVANSSQQQGLYRLSTRWQPDEQFSATLKLERQQNDQENPFAWQPGGCDNLYGLGLSDQQALNQFWQSTGSSSDNPLKLPATCKPNFVDNTFDRQSPASPHNQSQYDADQAVLTLNWAQDNWTLTSITSAYDNAFELSGNDLSHGTSPQRLLWLQDDVNFVSQAIRVEGSLNPTFDWQAGIYWHQEQVDYRSNDVDGRKQNAPKVTLTTVDQEAEQLSSFIGLTSHINSVLSLETRLQYIHTDKDFSGTAREQNKQSTGTQFNAFKQQINSDISANPGLYTTFSDQVRFDSGPQNYRFNDWLPEIKLSVTSPASSTFASTSWFRWTRGAKAGGFNFKLNNLTEENLTYRHEQVNNYALGTQLSAWNNKLILQAELFTAHYRDLQQNTHLGDDGTVGAAVVKNASRARSQGLDLNGHFAFNQAWSLNWQATWLDARYRDYQFADCTRLQSVVAKTDVASQFGATRQGNICYQDLSGQRMAHAPSLASQASLMYENTLDGFSTALSFSARIDWLYSDGYYTSPHADSLRFQPDYHKVNAWLSISDPQQWSLTVSLLNLTDKTTARQLGQDGNAAVSALRDPPKRWSIQGKIYF